MLNTLAGIIASSGGAAAGGSYESIATLTGNGTFTSIPSTYQHLQLRMLIRDGASAATGGAYLRFNGDTSSSYNWHYLIGNGSSASAGYTATNYMNLGDIPANTAASNTFGVLVVDILDYANTNKFKTTRSLEGFDANGSGQAALFSGLWRNTAAITSIECGGDSGSSISGTRIALYGIKG